MWHVSLQDATQRFLQRVIPIGLDDQGKRSKAIELLVNSYDQLRASESVLTAAIPPGFIRKAVAAPPAEAVPDGDPGLEPAGWVRPVEVACECVGRGRAGVDRSPP